MWKINDIKTLIKVYGESATLKDVLKKVQGDRKYKCPKCRKDFERFMRNE